MSSKQEQAEYEQATKSGLLQHAEQPNQTTAAIQAAANRRSEFPGDPVSVLKAIASATHAAQQTIDEHASGDHFSDDTLAAVAHVLESVRDAADPMVLYGVISRLSAP